MRRDKTVGRLLGTPFVSDAGLPGGLCEGGFGGLSLLVGGGHLRLDERGERHVGGKAVGYRKRRDMKAHQLGVFGKRQRLKPGNRAIGRSRGGNNGENRPHTDHAFLRVPGQAARQSFITSRAARFRNTIRRDAGMPIRPSRSSWVSVRDTVSMVSPR